MLRRSACQINPSIMLIIFRAAGTLHHDLTKPFARRLGGEHLDNIRERLETNVPSLARNKLYADRDLDKKRVARGNLTCTNKLSSLKEVRKKVGDKL
jgi:hypothetical protein